MQQILLVSRLFSTCTCVKTQGPVVLSLFFQGNTEQPVQTSKIGLGRREYQSLQHRHHSQRSKCRPPKGMYLTQEDVVAVSCSPNAANTILRQLDMELISLKRQVVSKNHIFNDSIHFACSLLSQQTHFFFTDFSQQPIYKASFIKIYLVSKL